MDAITGHGVNLVRNINKLSKHHSFKSYEVRP